MIDDNLCRKEAFSAESCAKARLDRFGEGLGRGELSFPPFDLSQVITETQLQVQRLGWSAVQIQQFIAECFDGKRRSLPEWGTDLHGICGVYGQSGGQPADGQETADAVEPKRSTFTAAG
jgi:hypothetical protein